MPHWEKLNTADNLFVFRGETFVLSADSEHLTSPMGVQLTYNQFRKEYLSNLETPLPRRVPRAVDLDHFGYLSPSKRQLIEAGYRASLYFAAPPPTPPEATELIFLYEYFLNKNIDGVISRNWRSYKRVFSTGENLEVAAHAFLLFGPLSNFDFLKFSYNSLDSISISLDKAAIHILPCSPERLRKRWEAAAWYAASLYLRVPPEERLDSYIWPAFYSKLYLQDGEGASLTLEIRKSCIAAFANFLREVRMQERIPAEIGYHLHLPETSYLPEQQFEIPYSGWEDYVYSLTDKAQQQRTEAAESLVFEAYKRAYPLLPSSAPFPTSVLNEVCSSGAKGYKKWEAAGYIREVGKKGRTKYWECLVDPFK